MKNNTNGTGGPKISPYAPPASMLVDREEIRGFWSTTALTMLLIATSFVAWIGGAFTRDLFLLITKASGFDEIKIPGWSWWAMARTYSFLLGAFLIIKIEVAFFKRIDDTPTDSRTLLFIMTWLMPIITTSTCVAIESAIYAAEYGGGRLRMAITYAVFLLTGKWELLPI